MVTDQRRVVDRAKTRHGEIQLACVAETHYEMVFNGVLLMATYNAPSSQQLVDVALSGLSAGRRNVELLIGGLGMGVALRHALKHPGIASVCVVELEPRIVRWNQMYLDNADILDDPRTEIVVGDFCDYVQGSPQNYNGIAVDIDNGPDWVVRPENRRAYSLSMLQVLRTRLRSGGTLAIWTHASNRSYERALQAVFDTVGQQTAVDVDLNGKVLESLIYEARE